MVRHLQTHPPKTVLISGPVGQLKATLEEPQAAPVGVVLHLHPHPEHGGTRRNNVVRHGALGSLEAGCVALRLDFRGVAGSGGAHDEGRGEVEDADAALTWLEQRYPGLPVFLWGFSFGSRVGLDLCLREAATQPNRIRAYLAVAWPNAFYPWRTADVWPEHMHFLVGTEDGYVDLSKGEIPNPTVIQGAGHFFVNELDEVRRFTRDAVLSHLA
jgi:hypothetical protein